MLVQYSTTRQHKLQPRVYSKNTQMNGSVDGICLFVACFFLSVMSFTTFWFIGLMIEACIVIMRRNSEARIKNYKKEKDQALVSTKKESYKK